MNWMALAIGFGGGAVAALITSAGTWVTTATGRRRDDRAKVRPAVEELADLFLRVVKIATPSPPNPVTPQLAFDEGIELFWNEQQWRFGRLVMEITDAALRKRLRRLDEAITLSQMAYYFGFPTHETFVWFSADVGAELCGAWLRGDKPEPEDIKRWKRIDKTITDFEEDWDEKQAVEEEMREEERKKARSGDSSPS